MYNLRSYSFMASLLAMPFPGVSLTSMDVPHQTGPGRKTHRIRTGRTYPHSSARQRARYKRQIESGMIKETA